MQREPALRIEERVLVGLEQPDDLGREHQIEPARLVGAAHELDEMAGEREACVAQLDGAFCKPSEDAAHPVGRAAMLCPSKRRADAAQRGVHFDAHSVLARVVQDGQPRGFSL
jgi:hypothetical protein